MASRNTKQRKEVKDEDDDEIKNIYDICGIPGLFKNILKFLNVKSICMKTIISQSNLDNVF